MSLNASLQFFPGLAQNAQQPPNKRLELTKPAQAMGASQLNPVFGGRAVNQGEANGTNRYTERSDGMAGTHVANLYSRVQAGTA
jgi:hypothetical protein